MALQKEIRSNSGIPLNYHRISQLDIETNIRVGIWLNSYISKEERDKEHEEVETVYCERTFYSTEELNDTNTVEDAYNWLKETYEQFKNAQDV